MKLTRYLKITVTRSRTTRLSTASLRAFCPVCARTVETLGVTQAAAALAVSPAQFQQLLDAAIVHALPTVSGSPRICQNSLFLE